MAPFGFGSFSGPAGTSRWSTWGGSCVDWSGRGLCQHTWAFPLLSRTHHILQAPRDSYSLELPRDHVVAGEIRESKTVTYVWVKHCFFETLPFYSVEGFSFSSVLWDLTVRNAGMREKEYVPTVNVFLCRLPRLPCLYGSPKFNGLQAFSGWELHSWVA